MSSFVAPNVVEPGTYGFLKPPLTTFPFRGQYDSLTVYTKGDIINYDTSTWLYSSDTDGNDAPPSANWQSCYILIQVNN